MAMTGDKYILHSENGVDFEITIIDVDNFRPAEMRYAADIYGGNGAYVRGAVFFGDAFLSKCEKVVDKDYKDKEML